LHWPEAHRQVLAHTPLSFRKYLETERRSDPFASAFRKQASSSSSFHGFSNLIEKNQDSPSAVVVNFALGSASSARRRKEPIDSVNCGPILLVVAEHKMIPT
jgi:hypothetical protein